MRGKMTAPNLGPTTISSPITNPAQAIFGMLIGVWFGNMAKDIILADPAKISAPILPVDWLKTFFTISAPIYFCLLAYCMRKSLENLYDSSNRNSEGVVITSKFAVYALVIIILLGFLSTTALLFSQIINPLYIIFGSLVFLSWIGVEILPFIWR
jgi:hypothetical protein